MAGSAWKHSQEADWLARLRSGDHDAFAEFVDKYKKTVFLCCRRLGLSVDEVEDVAAETFLAAYRALGRYGGRSQLSTWLWSIAYRRAIGHLRRNRRHLQLEEQIAAGIPDDEQPRPLVAAEAGETGRIVWQAVERLPRLWAMAVILHYREEKSMADIAQIMQTNQNTVKTYLFRGRQKLREILAPALGDNEDAAE